MMAEPVATREDGNNRMKVLPITKRVKISEVDIGTSLKNFGGR